MASGIINHSLEKLGDILVVKKGNFMNTNTTTRLSLYKRFKNFLYKKDIEFTFKRYGQEALSSMAMGVFSTLLVGLILKTIGEQMVAFDMSVPLAQQLIYIGKTAMSLVGGAIGIAVAWSLKAPPLVIFSSLVTGTLGAVATANDSLTSGGPVGAFVAALVGAEIGKMISKETKVDIIATPVVTIISGGIIAKLVSPIVAVTLNFIGKSVMASTDLQPFVMGMIVAVIIGIALTSPLSSAALCIMLDLSGITAGAATAGCCAQMVGFAAMSYKENGIGGLVAQGIGTSMLQIGNILKNLWIIVPPTIASAICGGLSTVLFKFKNTSAFAGMGTSGFVGQIGTIQSMGIESVGYIVILHFMLPAIISIVGYKVLVNIGKIHQGDVKLDI